jgi:mannose-6-phosphate isomerase-like protein (cupin superfamily)
MNLSFSSEVNKGKIFSSVEEFLSKKFSIISRDEERPWGGFFVIDEKQSNLFIKEFFPDVNEAELSALNKLSPKILVVGPGKKLSWQYHSRRAELWKVIGGEVGVVQSDTNEQGKLKIYKPYSVIKLYQGERHRLIGLDTWGIVAEIWQHTDINYPSDEEDIVRLQDDFGR